MGQQITFKRATISTTQVSLVFQVTKEGHPLFGQSQAIEVWEGVKADPGAKRSALKGSSRWPVAFTTTTAEEPKATIEGVPVEETRRLITWLGTGAATIEGTLTLIVRIPGDDPWELVLYGFAMETLGNIDIKREGSTTSLEGMYQYMTVDGIDPLADEAA